MGLANGIGRNRLERYGCAQDKVSYQYNQSFLKCLGISYFSRSQYTDLTPTGQTSYVRGAVCLWRTGHCGEDKEDSPRDDKKGDGRLGRDNYLLKEQSNWLEQSREKKITFMKYWENKRRSKARSFPPAVNNLADRFILPAYTALYCQTNGISLGIASVTLYIAQEGLR